MGPSFLAGTPPDKKEMNKQTQHTLTNVNLLGCYEQEGEKYILQPTLSFHF